MECIFQILYLCVAVAGRIEFLGLHYSTFSSNLIIVKLKKSNTGCVINRTYPGCCMYADDLIILSQSLSGSKVMLTNCLHTCSQLSLSLNANKSCCTYLGPRYNTVLDDLMLGNAKYT